MMEEEIAVSDENEREEMDPNRLPLPLHL